mgnify:CR=1 FL=1
MLKLEQRLRFDLAHALASDSEVAAYFIQRVLAAGMTEPEAGSAVTDLRTRAHPLGQAPVDA